MTRLIVLTALTGFTTLAATAQSTVSPIEIDKKMQQGLRLDLPNNTDMAEGTLLQKLKETGYTPETTGTMFWKKKKQDGFYVFNGVQLPDLNNQKLDLYFKIDRKTKKDKDSSTMSMLVSKGYDNFVTPESDSATFSAASRFLDGFLANTASYSLQQDIMNQEKLVASAEKKMQKLQDDDESLRKKIDQLNKDLVENRTAIELQAAEVAKQRASLETLKTKTVN
ncbi:MAG: hypothetical protein EOO05_03480 [Chitinophagaceae bacterium]|nr:MAG: hypothetical protein EOO05_03480 [Chitinophagaceae bacterium]